MQLLVEERIDEKLAVLLMQVLIDADDASLEIRLAVMAHTIVDDPAPWSVVCPCRQHRRL